MWRNRDGDIGRDVIHQGQNSDTESVKSGISIMMGNGQSGSRVGPKVWSQHCIMIITTS